MPDLLIEIGVEELPANRVRAAGEALRRELAERLVEAGLLEATTLTDDAPTLATPRRLAAHVPGVRDRQEDRQERAWGPPVRAAFDADGQPTKAGEGFARSMGVAVADLDRGEKQPGKPDYLFLDRVLEGRPAAVIVAEILPEVLRRLPFRKTMRWPQSDLAFARPIRSITVLLGDAVVPCSLAGVTSDRTVRGHDFLAPDAIDLPDASLDGYVAALRAARVIVDVDERLRTVRDGVAAGRAEAGGAAAEDGARDAAEDALFEEVAGLVEWPTAVVGSFDARYLDLPEPVLVTSMAHHLRYFPVRAPGGALTGHFVSVTDREAAAAEGIRDGNERVLRARLFDAEFFFRNDRERPLAAFRDGLAGVDFHRGLGTLLAKSERVRGIAGAIVEAAGLGSDARALVDRAAELLKCDLRTAVVGEFPELQGIIGAGYARLDGEAEAVAAALEGQYLPRGEWDAVLDDDVAAVVSLAEKTDSLVAYFSVGEEPTGSADPFGLRRDALGLLRILAKKGWAVSIEDALAPARVAWNLPAEIAPRLHAFVWGRAEQEARAHGFVDYLDAVGALTDRPYHEYRQRLDALRTLHDDDGWKGLVGLVERTLNMGVAGEPPTDAADLPPEAAAVHEAWATAVRVAEDETDPVAFGRKYAELLVDRVETLFEAVLIDDPSTPGRTASLKALLHAVGALFRDRLGDLRRLGGGAKP